MGQEQTEYCGNNTLPMITYQLVFLDLPASSNGVAYVTLAHNLMTSSTRQSTNEQQTDGGNS